MGREEAVDRPEGESEHQVIEPRKSVSRTEASHTTY
jgi:hypothetical protein